MGWFGGGAASAIGLGIEGAGGNRGVILRIRGCGMWVGGVIVDTSWGAVVIECVKIATCKDKVASRHKNEARWPKARDKVGALCECLGGKRGGRCGKSVPGRRCVRWKMWTWSWMRQGG